MSVEKVRFQTLEAPHVSMAWLRKASAKDMATRFNTLLENAHLQNPFLNTYDICKTVAKLIPQGIPRNTYQTALDAAASPNRETQVAGKQALLMLTLNSILHAAEPYMQIWEEKPDKQEEVMHSIIDYIGNKASQTTNVHIITTQIYRLTQTAIGKHIAVENNIPTAVGQNKNYVLVLHAIDYLSRIGPSITQSEFDQIVTETARETGVSRTILREYFSRVVQYVSYDENNLQAEGDQTWNAAKRAFFLEDIAKALDTLPPYQRRIIQLRYGLDGKERTLAEAGKELKTPNRPEGITGERVRQIEAKALKGLRRRNLKPKGEDAPAVLKANPIRPYVPHSPTTPLLLEASITQAEKEMAVRVSFETLSQQAQQTLIEHGVRTLVDLFRASPEDILPKSNHSNFILAIKEALLQLSDFYDESAKEGSCSNYEFLTQVADAATPHILRSRYSIDQSSMMRRLIEQKRPFYIFLKQKIFVRAYRKLQLFVYSKTPTDAEVL